MNTTNNTTKPLWGITGHPYGSAVTIDQQLALVQALGLDYYRMDCNSLAELPALQAAIASAKTKGIKVLPVISAMAGLDLTQPEQAVYASANIYARQVALAVGADAPIWECGNESEQYCIASGGDVLDDGSLWQMGWGSPDGSSPGNYIAARYDKTRGMIRGFVDGVHQAGGQAIVNTAGWFHYGFLQRLTMDGVPFDKVGWHWYSQMGDITNAAPDASGKGTNIAQQLKAFGKPIWLTEFNNSVGSQVSNAEESTVLASMANAFAALASAYGFEALMAFELADNVSLPLPYGCMGLYGVAGGALSAPKPAFCALRDVVAKAKAA